MFDIINKRRLENIRVSHTKNEGANKLVGQWIAGPEISIANRFIQGFMTGNSRGIPDQKQAKSKKYELLEFRSDGTGVVKSSNSKLFNETGIPLQLWTISSDSIRWIWSGEKWTSKIDFPLEEQLVFVFKNKVTKGPFLKVTDETQSRDTREYWKE